MAKIADVDRRERDRLEQLLKKRRERVHDGEAKLAAHKKRVGSRKKAAA